MNKKRLFFYIFFLASIKLFSQDLKHPESIYFDAQKERYLISDAGNFQFQDGHLFTLKDGKFTRFAQAILHDPRGFAIVENVVYINDIDRIVMVDANSGIFIKEVICPGAYQLTGMSSDGYTTLYLSDPIANQIFSYNITLNKFDAIASPVSPNGILYDGGLHRLLIATHEKNGKILELDIKNKILKVKTDSAGNYLYGICRGGGGYFYYSSWGIDYGIQSGKIFKIKTDFSEAPVLVDDSLNSPSGMIYNYYNDSLAINLLMESKIHFINFSAPIAPRPPDLDYPKNYSKGINQKLNFLWKKPKRSEKFEFELSLDEDFKNLIVDTVITDTSLFYVLPWLNRYYFWRVKAINYAGDSFWSEVYSFSAKESVYDGPQLLSPENLSGSVELYAHFVWAASSLLPIYKIEVAKDGNFTEITSYTRDITDTTYVLDNPLQNNTVYWWHVKAYSGKDSSDWSQPFMFRTRNVNTSQTILDLPKNSSDSVPVNAVLKWKNMNASLYEVQLSDNPFFKKPIFTEKSMDTIHIVPKNKLVAEKEYYWHVRAFFDVEDGEWSEIWKFKTIKDTIVSNNDIIQEYVFLSPNPANHFIQLHIPNNTADYYDIDITNISGSCNLLQRDVFIDKTYTLDVSNLPQGTYVLKINSKNNFSVKKLSILK